MDNKYDLTGQKFGDLTVISFSHKNEKQRVNHWKCLCICGNETIVASTSLRRKKRPTISCGCYRNKRIKETGAWNKLSKNESNFNSLMYSYKKSALARNVEFNLNKEEFRILTSSNCYYCDKKPTQIMGKWDTNGDYIYNGVDRLNSDLGYFTNNCVPCCKACNYAKRQMTVDEFKNWIKRLYKHFILKNSGCKFCI